MQNTKIVNVKVGISQMYVSFNNCFLLCVYKCYLGTLNGINNINPNMKKEI